MYERKKGSGESAQAYLSLFLLENATNQNHMTLCSLERAFVVREESVITCLAPISVQSCARFVGYYSFGLLHVFFQKFVPG